MKDLRYTYFLNVNAHLFFYGRHNSLETFVVCLSESARQPARMGTENHTKRRDVKGKLLTLKYVSHIFMKLKVFGSEILNLFL